ncbi:MAG TPA: type I-E CRISPR-associated protein Cse2/CasB [Acidobacteriota bacterium]|nr:type I-E CRISPR-associated protein Cse2/CasB [Acidobacteriota bacterium]
MSQLTPKERAARFVGALRPLAAKQDRGALAVLRRGLSPATVVDAWPVVARLGGDIGQPGESTHVDIAALFATHPAESNARNFGETCRAIALDPNKRGELVESHERRFRRLLAADSAADLSGQLRTWVRLAASKSVGINYESLFYDLRRWDRFAADVRVEWARSFWRSGEDEAAPATSTADTTAS